MYKDTKILYKNDNCLVLEDGQVLYSIANLNNFDIGNTIESSYHDSKMLILCFKNSIKLPFLKPKRKIREFVFQDDLDGFKVISPNLCIADRGNLLTVIDNIEFYNNAYSKDPIIHEKAVADLSHARFITYYIDSVNMLDQTIKQIKYVNGEIVMTTSAGTVLTVSSIYRLE